MTPPAGCRSSRSLVGRFYDGVAADPDLLRVYPEPDDLSEARRNLTLFLAQYWGGPRTYDGERGHPRLRMRHAPFAIGPAERDRWLLHMRAAIAASCTGAGRCRPTRCLFRDGGRGDAEPGVSPDDEVVGDQLVGWGRAVEITTRGRVSGRRRARRGGIRRGARRFAARRGRRIGRGLGAQSRSRIRRVASRPAGGPGTPSPNRSAGRVRGRGRRADPQVRNAVGAAGCRSCVPPRGRRAGGEMT